MIKKRVLPLPNEPAREESLRDPEAVSSYDAPFGRRHQDTKPRIKVRGSSLCPRPIRCLLSNGVNVFVVRGVTLLELLIAISIFVFLCGLLAGLLGVSLGLWKSGEHRGDIYDRAQLILEQIRTDLESIYIEKETSELTKMEGVPLPEYISNQEPSFYMDIDPNGNHWFYLVRADEDGFYGFLSDTPTKQFQRVLYYVKTNQSGKNSLVRRTLSKNKALNFWRKKDISPQFQHDESELTFKNILYLGMSVVGGRAWKKKHNIQSKWNSLPPEAALLRPGSPDSVIIPEQFLPGAVEIEVIISPSVFLPPKILLNDEINPGSLVLKVTSTKGLASPPNYLKIEKEWMLYKEIGFDTITIDKRGVRNTRATAHLKNAEITYGETIKRVYYLPTTANFTTKTRRH